MTREAELGVSIVAVASIATSCGRTDLFGADLGAPLRAKRDRGRALAEADGCDHPIFDLL